MENILQLLPIGVITLSVLGLAVAALVLAGLYQTGILTLKLLLNADHENAPDFNWKNRVWAIASNLPPFKSPVEKVGTNWRVRSGLGKYKDLVDGGSLGKDDHYYKDCLTSCYSKVKRFDKKALDPQGVFILIASTVVIDTLLVAVQYYFFPTIILSSIALVVFGVRTLAGKVYTNSSKITNHKERIESLETKGE